MDSNTTKHIPRPENRDQTIHGYEYRDIPTQKQKPPVSASIHPLHPANRPLDHTPPNLKKFTMQYNHYPHSHSFILFL